MLDIALGKRMSLLHVYIIFEYPYIKHRFLFSQESIVGI